MGHPKLFCKLIWHNSTDFIDIVQTDELLYQNYIWSMGQILTVGSAGLCANNMTAQAVELHLKE